MPAMETRRKGCGAWMASAFLLVLLVLCPASSGSERHVDAQLMTHARRLQETEGLNPLFRSRLLKLLPMIAEGFPVDGLLPNHRGNTALHYACAIGDLELVTCLLERGANPRLRTRRGASASDCASGPRRAQIQRLLHQHRPCVQKEEPPAPSAELSPPPAAPQLPYSQEEMEQLLDNLRGVSCQNDRLSRHKKALLQLLPLIQGGKGIDYPLPGTGGQTALHHACAMDDFVLVISLLEHGANPLARTRKGQTPESFLQGHNAAFIRAHLTEFATHGSPSEQKR